MSSNPYILLLGHPSTGKTTFTAALWFYVTHWSDERVIKLETLASGNHEYLNGIRDHWAMYNTVPRTLLTDIKNHRILMHLNISNSGEKFILDIPDFSGEIFKEHFKSREWSIEFDKQLESVNGIILFVSSIDSNAAPKFITHQKELEQILGGDSQPQASAEVVDWNHDFASTQVKLVDSLQSIRTQKKFAGQLKVSIVISAWDKVLELHAGNSIPNPKTWIENNFPLMSQYLDCNSDLFFVKYFGVSAQGGDYANKESLDALVSKDPLKRPIVQEDGEVSSNITRPIFWLLS